MPKCIGFGDKEGKCENEVDLNINPYWCPECNEVRVKKISSNLDDMIENFPE